MYPAICGRDKLGWGIQTVTGYNNPLLLDTKGAVMSAVPAPALKNIPVPHPLGHGV